MPLPLQLLRQRINRELAACQKISGVTVDREAADGKIEFPICFDISINGASGLTLVGGTVKECELHRFSLEIGRDYPYQKPSLFWQTPIFHPNICPPEAGGMVCTRLLNEWKAERTISSLIYAVMYLIEHPNFMEPLGSDACMNAARYLLERAPNDCQNSEKS